MRRVHTTVQLALAFPILLHALDPQKSITQFVHTSWTDREGAPQNVQALAQTADGYLWLGTPTGLFRFDGVRFTEFEASGGGKLPGVRIRSLLAARDGSLWIVFVSGPVTHLVHDSATTYAEANGLPPVLALAESATGRLVAVTSKGLWIFENGVWTDGHHIWRSPPDAPQQVFYDRSDNLWVVAGEKVFVLRTGLADFADSGEPGFKPSSYHLTQDRDGLIWFVEDGRVVHTLPAQNSPSPTRIHIGAGPILFDRDGGLWMGTYGDGLLQAPVPEVIRGLDIPGLGPHLQQMTRRDGLSSEYVISLLEDREGNIWCGTPRGLDRLRPTAFSAVSTPQPSVPRALFGANSGILWTFTLSPHDLSRVMKGAVESFAGTPRTNITTLAECRNGPLLAGGATGLFRFDEAAFTPIPIADAENMHITGLACDPSGAIWFSEGHGLLRYAEGRLEKSRTWKRRLTPLC